MPQEMSGQSNEDVLVVLNGFINLSTNQRVQFFNLLNNYNESEASRKLLLEAGFRKAAASTGPLGNNRCKCCGR